MGKPAPRSFAPSPFRVYNPPMSDANPLTRRESEILDLLAEGLSNDEIAYQLGISPNTVKVHVRNIFEKMEVQSRTEATMEALRRGWIRVPGIEAPQVEASAEPLSWPPLESGWRSWQLLVLLAVFVGVSLFVFWPYRSISVKVAGAPAFTTDSGSAVGVVTPRQDAPRWSQRAAMPTARSRAGGAQIDGRLYVVGEIATGDTAALEMYDPNLDVWQRLPERPVAARGVGAAAVDGKLYAAGGCAGESAITNVDRYNPGAQMWSSVAPLPEARCGLALVALDGRLYALGGWDGGDVTDTLFIFNPEQDRWEEGRRLPEPRAFLGGVSFLGQIYALGGHDGVKQRSEVWVYDPADDAWTPAPSLPESRSGVAAAAEGVSIYAIGGGQGEQPPLHERFDTLTRTWSTIDSPRTGPWRHAVAVVIGPNLYVVGGWGGDYLANNEAYQASHLLFLPLGAQGLQ
ncbi:MAG TPA: hypothetical protein G4N94_11470 [Caldilineae bacterium]|nr:hypothetical protein [Caldilineae bacterium]